MTRWSGLPTGFLTSFLWMEIEVSKGLTRLPNLFLPLFPTYFLGIRPDAPSEMGNQHGKLRQRRWLLSLCVLGRPRLR